MALSSSLAPRLQLGKALRERYLEDVSKALVDIGEAVQNRLTELVVEPSLARESQLRRDAWTAYKTSHREWVSLTLKEWRACLEPVKKDSKAPDLGAMQLVSTDAMENKILASRMVLSVNEKVIGELDDLRVRIKYLESLEDLDNRDLLRPEVLVLLLVEQWPLSGMSPESWGLVSDSVQRGLVGAMTAAYKVANTVLINKGVLPVIDLKDRVKAPRSTGGVARAGEASQTAAGALQTGHSTGAAPLEKPPGSGFFSGRLGWRGAAPQPEAAATAQGSGPGSDSTPFWKQSTQATNSMRGQAYLTAEETRMLTAGTPLARARSRALGVLGQLKRIITSSSGHDYVVTMH